MAGDTSVGSTRRPQVGAYTLVPVFDVAARTGRDPGGKVPSLVLAISCRVSVRPSMKLQGWELTMHLPEEFNSQLQPVGTV